MEIENYENYLIYQDGRVFNKRYNRFLKHTKENYYYVRLCKNGKNKKFYIHRLIAEYYIDNPENKTYIDHINGDPLNNDISNLRWVTNIENTNAFKSQRLDNTSGIKNICQHKKGKGWQYKKIIFGKTYFKFFKNKNDAIWHKFIFEMLNRRY